MMSCAVLAERSTREVGRLSLATSFLRRVLPHDQTLPPGSLEQQQPMAVQATSGSSTRFAVML